MWSRPNAHAAPAASRGPAELAVLEVELSTAVEVSVRRLRLATVVGLAAMP